MAELKLYSNERIAKLPYKTIQGIRYAITDYGRVISYLKKPEEGTFLKPSDIKGYPCVSFRSKNKPYTFMVHRLVAEYFLDKPSSKHKYVLHLNFKKEDNYVYNLKWATGAENRMHFRTNKRLKSKSQKLTEAKVIAIKKRLLKGNTRLKMIGKQFGVSDMQIHRIKTGENWGHVKV